MILSNEPKVVRRNPWLAGFLSLVAPGLGQILDGRWKTGIALFLGLQLCTNLLFLSRVWVNFAGLEVTFSLAGLFGLWSAFDAVRQAKRRAPTRLQSHRRWYYYVLFFAALFLCGRVNYYLSEHLYGFRAFRIPTGSMENSLLVGDYIVADKHFYAKHEPAAGDLGVLCQPSRPSLQYIKRCVAGPGHTVEIRDKQLYVDGVPVENPLSVKFTSSKILPKGVREREIFSPNGEPWNRDNFGPVTVPQNCYFVMGDNRDNSADSRYWGFLPRENIVGKPLYICFSWDKHSSAVRWDRFGKKIE